MVVSTYCDEIGRFVGPQCQRILKLYRRPASSFSGDFAATSRFPVMKWREPSHLFVFIFICFIRFAIEGVVIEIARLQNRLFVAVFRFVHRQARVVS
jgi:hypothetical protein